MREDTLPELRLLVTRLASLVQSSPVHQDARLEAARAALECAYVMTADVGADGSVEGVPRLDNLRQALGAARAAVVAASYAVRAEHDAQRLHLSADDPAGPPQAMSRAGVSGSRLLLSGYRGDDGPANDAEPHATDDIPSSTL
jgi:hypothetical protein